MDASPAGLDDPASLTITGAFLIGASGIPGLFLPTRRDWGEKCAALAVALGSLLGLSGTLAALLSERTSTHFIASALPFGPFEAGIEPLSAVFLRPVFSGTDRDPTSPCATRALIYPTADSICGIKIDGGYPCRRKTNPTT